MNCSKNVLSGSQHVTSQLSEQQRGVRAAEAEAVRQRRSDGLRRARLSLARDHVPQRRVRQLRIDALLQVDRRRQAALAEREDREDRLDRPPKQRLNSKTASIEKTKFR